MLVAQTHNLTLHLLSFFFLTSKSRKAVAAVAPKAAEQNLMAAVVFLRTFGCCVSFIFERWIYGTIDGDECKLIWLEYTFLLNCLAMEN
jgi:hypothetical protein